MKTIGKIAALAMTMSLAFVLTACGGSASSSAAASSASASASSASAAASSTAASSAAASSAASTAASSAASSTSAAEADTYTNAAFGIEYDLPQGWKFLDADSIKQLNSAVSSITAGEGVEMIAAAPDGATSVIVALAEPSSATTGKTAADFLKTQVDDMQKALQGNFSYTSNDAEITFNGLTRTLPANITTMTIEGASLTIGQAVAEKDGYFLDIIVVGATEDDVLNAFKAFKATAA